MLSHYAITARISRLVMRSATVCRAAPRITFSSSSSSSSSAHRPLPLAPPPKRLATMTLPAHAETETDADADTDADHASAHSVESTELAAYSPSAASSAMQPAHAVTELVQAGMPVGEIPAPLEEKLLAAMRTEHALMVEEMQSWDKDPIWLAYEEEANKLVWDINQKWNKLGMHLRDPRIREQVHVEMAAALEDLQQRYAKEVAAELSDADLIRLMRLPPDTKLNEVNVNEVMRRLFGVGTEGSSPFGIDDADVAAPPPASSSQRPQNTAANDSDSLLAAAAVEKLPRMAAPTALSQSQKRSHQQSGQHSRSAEAVAEAAEYAASQRGYDEDKDLVLRHVDDDFTRRALGRSRRMDAEESKADLQRLFDDLRRQAGGQSGSGGPNGTSGSGGQSGSGVQRGSGGSGGAGRGKL